MNLDTEYLEAIIEQLKASGEPEHATIAHDVKYALEAITASFSEDAWHNNGVGLISSHMANEFVPSVAQLIMLEGPEVLPRLIEGLIDRVFVAGYIAGEGPDHIHKCKCQTEGKHAEQN